MNLLLLGFNPRGQLPFVDLSLLEVYTSIFCQLWSIDWGGITSPDAEVISSPDAGVISNLDSEVSLEVISATAEFHNMDMGEMVRDGVD